jgi:hypothetical protein
MAEIFAEQIRVIAEFFAEQVRFVEKVTFFFDVWH